MEVPYLAPIELQRQQIIARNRARLLALGIPQAIEGLNKLVPAKPPKTHRPKRPADQPAEPTRHSVRLSDREAISRGEAPSGVEPGSELALFIIDGECPRCGKVLSVGHVRHLELCKGPPEPPTEEELAAQAAAYRSEQKDRLKQLELGGLVDFYTPAAAAAHDDAAVAAPAADTPAAAAAAGSADAASLEAAAGTEADQQQQQQQEGKGNKAAAKKQKKGKQPAAAAAAAVAPGGDGAYAVFIVIGSRGDHYTVTLRDEKRTCQCLDHRFRRHDCKHIRLILEQLGVADDPSAWQQALQQHLGALGAADEEDVRRVKEAQQRAQQRQQKAADKAAAAAEAAAAGGGLGAGVDGADEAAGEGVTAAAVAAAAAAAAVEDTPGNASKPRKGAGRKRKA